MIQFQGSSLEDVPKGMEPLSDSRQGCFWWGRGNSGLSALGEVKGYLGQSSVFLQFQDSLQQGLS